MSSAAPLGGGVNLPCFQDLSDSGGAGVVADLSAIFHGDLRVTQLTNTERRSLREHVSVT